MKSKVWKHWVLMIFQFFCSPFSNEITIFSANAPHMMLQPTDQFLPTLLPLPAWIHYNWATRQKEWWETVFFFDNSVILLTFFNRIALFGENAWFVISQLTDIFLPRHRRCQLALIKTDQGRKKNGEKPLRFDDFAILRLTFFYYIAIQLVQTCNLW